MRGLLIFIAVGLLLGACTMGDSGRAAAGAEGKTKELSVLITCSTCHRLPDPGDLPTGIWDTVVLPRMGHFLGRYAPGERAALLAADPAGRGHLLAANVYPTELLVSDEDWAVIRAYYLERAPVALPGLLAPDTTRSQLFQARYPNAFLSPPSGSYVGIPTEGGVLLGDINKEILLAFNHKLEPIKQLPVGPGVTAIDGRLATVIGSFSPTDAATGRLVELEPGGARTVIDALQRPTSVVRLQLDDDPEAELIITEYGKWTGRLATWDRDASGNYQPTILSKQPGAITTIVNPSSRLPEVFVLYGQGREEVVRYRFKDSVVQAKTVLRFPPSYGSSSLQLTNWNGDSLPDLIYTAGDNADYASGPKPYHGIRVFTGTTDGMFDEALFLPLPGAYAAVAADFDEDGDLDLAAISFFPDFSAEYPATAVYYTNESDGTFSATRLPGADSGRFIRLTAGDFDLDGDTDLAAATLAMEAVPDGGRMARWLNNGLPFVVWENNLPASGSNH